jgi:hypothetical protein
MAMRRLPTNEPVWDLHFDEQGRLTSPSKGDVLDEVTTKQELTTKQVDDLFVFSHGWGTSEQNARDLYDEMFPLIRDAAASEDGIGTVGFAGIYWPSLWFPPTPATPPPTARSTQADGGGVLDLDAGTGVLSGKEIAESLLPAFSDPGQQATLTEIGRLIDEGQAASGSGQSDDAKRQRLEAIHERLRSLLPPAPAEDEVEDGGERALLGSGNATSAYQAVAEEFGTAGSGSSSQGIGDWFHNAINGAKDALRVFSYTTMKARAGNIGRSGLGPLLTALHGRSPALRVHLIGHSFGARLVSFALAGVGQPADTPVASLVLLQAAFSHWTFAHAQDNPFGKPGALNAVTDRVHGPLVSTFSVHDWAVGVWYPKASFLAHQDIEAETASRWGGLGADGFQAVNPWEDRIMPAAGGASYMFTPGTFYRANGANVINNTQGQPFAGAHCDIRKPAVAELIAAAAAAHR